MGGVPIGNPTLISSVPNSTAAIDGNNAQVRVILDGNQTGGSTGSRPRNASHSIIRGLAIEGFGIGISVPDPSDVGDLIQGNSIGEYLAYPVDSLTRSCLCRRRTRSRSAGLGNTQQGILLGSANATVGGTEPQDANVIGGNGAQGVLIEPGASGNQVLGNQIGVAGPSTSGGFISRPATARTESLIESSGTRGQSVEHRLFVEQRDRRRRRGVGQHHLGQSRLRRSHRSASEPPGILSRPTTSARLRAAVLSSATASPAMRLTAFGSTTPPTTRSAARRQPTAM